MYEANKNCNGNISGCVPGCPQTILHRMTASGFSADIANIARPFMMQMINNRPFQVFPVVLGYYRLMPMFAGIEGWTYTFGMCKSNFLDCVFLDNSPCPKIRYDVQERTGRSDLNRSRLRINGRPDVSRPSWFLQAFGDVTPVQPADIFRYFWDIPFTHAAQTYFSRPKYKFRMKIHKRVNRFDYGDMPCAVMHVRRGDILIHKAGQGRGYLPVDAYVKAGRPYMDELGIRTILLLTDSQSAIDEALQCGDDHPEICGGITFKYVHKKRWIGAEGGWENPFPTGSPEEELMVILTEMALSQQCDMMIQGQSSYADRLYSHMCCNYPLQKRGQVPQRCICPPRITLEQRGFTCETGNYAQCDNQSDMHQSRVVAEDHPINIKWTNFSKSKDAYKSTTKVWNENTIDRIIFDATVSDEHIWTTRDQNVIKQIKQSAVNAKKSMCRNIDYGLARPRTNCEES